MLGTRTRCGFCGRHTVTRDGRCPVCAQVKHPSVPWKPAPPPSLWREARTQLAAVGVGVLLLVAALLTLSEAILVAAVVLLGFAFVGMVLAAALD